MKSVLFILLFAGKLTFQLGYSQNSIPPFTNNATTTLNNAKITGINATISGNKILLAWSVSENQAANLFEIEKSADGKNFTMAALVFGTDKAETDKYQYYETAKSGQIITYRIKLVSKNNSAVYSDTVQAGTTSNSM